MTKSARMRKLQMNCPEKQFERKHRKDQERDDKIKYFSLLLKKESIDVGGFLEAVANKTILPLNGNSTENLVFYSYQDYLKKISAIHNILLERTSSQNTVGVSYKSRKIKKRAKKTKKVKKRGKKTKKIKTKR